MHFVDFGNVVEDFSGIKFSNCSCPLAQESKAGWMFSHKGEIQKFCKWPPFCRAVQAGAAAITDGNILSRWESAVNCQSTCVLFEGIGCKPLLLNYLRMWNVFEEQVHLCMGKQNSKQHWKSLFCKMSVQNTSVFQVQWTEMNIQCIQLFFFKETRCWACTECF